MKRFSEQLHKKALAVKLRAAEKRELRERVVSYMEYHPLPKSAKVTKPVPSNLLTEEYKEVFLPWKQITRWAVGAFAIIIVSVPFAAERAVPGDGLYAVKRFNEEVRGTLAFDTVQKVEWETERLNRRIAEARLLASEGRLTDEVEAEVAAAVRTHTENAQKNIAALRSEDADEATLASLALETTLAVQSAALNDEEGESAEDAMAGPSILAAVVAEELEEANATNETVEIPAFDKTMAKVEQNTTRVYELRNSLIDTATGEQIAEINRRIEDIDRSVAEAIALRVEDDEAARAVLIDSLQRAQKLIVFMTDIEVSQTVDIETIVPVVLTDAEKAAILTDYQTELDIKVAAIEGELEVVADEAVAEKANEILAEVVVLQAEIASTTDFVTTEASFVSAIELANNIYTLLELDQKEVPTEEVIELPEETSSSTDATASSSDEVAEETETSEETTEAEGVETETEEETEPAAEEGTETGEAEAAEEAAGDESVVESEAAPTEESTPEAATDSSTVTNDVNVDTE